MKTILVIDDEPELLDLLKYFFKQLNYTIITFTHAVPVETIEDIMPLFIVLDYNLGTTTGDDLCRELKAYPPTQNIPVIMLSANKELPQLAKDSCADAFLFKPFDIAELHRTVKNAELLQTS